MEPQPADHPPSADNPPQEEYIEATTDIPDEGYEDEPEQPHRSSMTSLSSRVLEGVMENGRTYAAYGKEGDGILSNGERRFFSDVDLEYGMPSDELELERLDFAHTIYYILLEKKHFLAPITDTPHKILDLGTGTGKWCVDIADMFRTAYVLGVDIAPTQPEWVPPNCHFEIDDIERRWTRSKESFGFVFARDLLYSIRDWPRLIKQAYDHLKPGGWIEFDCIYGVLKCDDGTLPEDSNIKKFDSLIREASVRYGTPLEAPENFKKWFEEAGFEGVVERRFKIPTNTWPKDDDYKMVGMLERENLLSGIEGMSMRLFDKVLGWDDKETNVLLALVRQDIKKTEYHMYHPFYVVYGQKPERPPS
ncbi:MAG: hypothetical protein M1820_003711 [Bogoriella megaspora]|nr:MAG: hypothetical protein M1820_003711 [Bogoriella megaspora]